MLNLNKYPTNCFSYTYRQLISSLHNNVNVDINNHSSLLVLEGTEKLIKEELVRCIWFGQHFKKDKLYTDDGLRLEVLSPGWWNSEGGPDFKHAEILLEGKGLVKGNIEIHVFASDWMKHQHDKQETYDSICLHVTMWNDNEGKYIKNSLGQIVTQLTLSQYLDAELDDIIDVVDVESYLKGRKVHTGHCHREIENQKIDEQWVGHFLDYAGDERILQKAKRYEEWLKKKPFEQTIYEAIMESLGYKENKEPFLRLASLVSLEDFHSLIPEDIPIQTKKLHTQSLLLGVAGLLPHQRNSEKLYNDETTKYINDLEDAWKVIQAKINKASMIKDDWSYAKIRPANFPERRIAAIANILSECAPNGIFHRILWIFQTKEDYTREHINTLINTTQSLFLNIHDPYWSYHYTIGGIRLKNPQKLLGKERTSNIFMNVIIPILLIYARKHNDVRLEKVLHLLYRNYPPLPMTSVIRFMENRILGQSKASKKIINSIRRQQGLYQIFKDFCENDNISCNKCVLYLSMVES
ncbi:MAG: hypothetical protein JETT_0394 [Candidatus Jettenia ecosi]|uniref:DUF2851 family protein n=1 Tax=Candidatus Jettenia ecosi TaxID=2494326 RepID=A0A533QEN5_9BACT|nr:MAG: hypothetical protein JETT_0394 [Candidatus Jettenia ecosi]